MKAVAMCIHKVARAPRSGPWRTLDGVGSANANRTSGPSSSDQRSRQAKPACWLDKPGLSSLMINQAKPACFWALAGLAWLDGSQANTRDIG